MGQGSSNSRQTLLSKDKHITITIKWKYRDMGRIERIRNRIENVVDSKNGEVTSFSMDEGICIIGARFPSQRDLKAFKKEIKTTNNNLLIK